MNQVVIRVAKKKYFGNLVGMSSRRGRPIKWAEEVGLEALRRYEAECLAKGEKVTENGYDRWCKLADNAPSSGTLRRSGISWNALRLRVADYPDEIELNPPTHLRRWTEEKCLTALRRYQAEQQQAGGKVTFQGYDQWQRGQKDAPSPYTVKNLTGQSWQEIVRRASLCTGGEQER